MNKHEILLGAISAIGDESDRGCVLAGTSLIEWQLERVLRTEFLRTHEKSGNSDDVHAQIDILLDPSSDKAILGSAASRSRMCRVLNLIDPGIHKSLKLLFSFRNTHFAHSLKPVQLTDTAVLNALAKLTASTDGFDKVVRSSKFSKEKNDFVGVVLLLYFLLQQVIDHGPAYRANTDAQPYSAADSSII